MRRLLSFKRTLKCLIFSLMILCSFYYVFYGYIIKHVKCGPGCFLRKKNVTTDSEDVIYQQRVSQNISNRNLNDSPWRRFMPEIYESKFSNAISAVDGSIKREESDKKNVTLKKIVLLWNGYYRGHYDDYGQRGMIRYCPDYQCIFSHNRSLQHQADAIVFNSWVNDKWTEYPKTRTPSQRYVFFARESPARFKPDLQSDHFFNLTMTYRIDSDVPILSGNFYKRDVPINDTEWSRQIRDTRLRTRMVAWLVSHCNTKSKRELYVERLREQIEVDIYGECGKLKCLPKRTSKCLRKVGKTHKFFLAFENSICPHYISEKPYHLLNNGMVPIVYGGADYAKMLPKGSYIDVSDFKSVNELATFLRRFKDDETYLKYLEWRRYYITSHDNEELSRSLCNLCRLLHNESYPIKSYSIQQMRDFWSAQTCESNYLRNVMGEV